MTAPIKISNLAATALIGGALVADLLQVLFKVFLLSIFLGIFGEGLSMLLSIIVLTFYSVYFYVLKHLGLLQPRYFLLFITAVLLEIPPVINVAFGLTFWTWRTLVRARKDAHKHAALEEKKKKQQARDAKLMKERLRRQRREQELYVSMLQRSQEEEQLLLWQQASQRRSANDTSRAWRDYSQPPPPATAYTAQNDNAPRNKARAPFEGDQRPQKAAAA